MVAAFTKWRRETADAVVAPLYHKYHWNADEVTRLSGWFAFFSGWLLLAGSYGVSATFLFVALALDALDGALARLQGVSNPQIDTAMDRFTEAVLSTALLWREPSWISWGFVAAFILNNFLPRWGIPILAHRWVMWAYLVYLWASR